MRISKPNILIWSASLFVTMIVLAIVVFHERFTFYWNTKDTPATIVAPYETGLEVAPKPNLDLGFVSFFLKLSPQAILKKSDSSISIKDQNRTLLINLPEVLSEMMPNPNYPDDIVEFDRLVAKYGNIVRAQKAAFETTTDLSVLFCSTNDFECLKSLWKIKFFNSIHCESREFLSSFEFDAIISRYSNGKFAEIYWSTSQGNRLEQQRGIIMISDKSLLKNSDWSKQFIRSMIIHPKGEVISPDEMLIRLEKLKQPTR